MHITSCRECVRICGLHVFSAASDSHLVQHANLYIYLLFYAFNGCPLRSDKMIFVPLRRLSLFYYISYLMHINMFIRWVYAQLCRSVAFSSCHTPAPPRRVQADLCCMNYVTANARIDHVTSGNIYVRRKFRTAVLPQKKRPKQMQTRSTPRTIYLFIFISARQFRNRIAELWIGILKNTFFFIRARSKFSQVGLCSLHGSPHHSRSPACTRTVRNAPTTDSQWIFELMCLFMRLLLMCGFDFRVFHTDSLSFSLPRGLPLAARAFYSFLYLYKYCIISKSICLAMNAGVSVLHTH